MKKKELLFACIFASITFAPQAEADDLVELYYTSGTREYNFSSASDVYTIVSDLGTMSPGEFTINGVIDDEIRSTVDADGHKLFYVGNGSTLNLNNVAIKNGNKSGNYGGAILNYGTIEGITNSNFTSNSAQCGGAIYNDNGTIEGITNSNFTSNSAQCGGAIYNDNGTIEGITNSNFTSNSAGYGGGAIYNDNGTIGDITGSNFTSNSANVGGGAIYNNNGTIDNIIAEFVENSANSYGGAIVNYGNIESIKADFTSNSAKGTDGGAIYNYVGTIGDITNSTFTSNSASSEGGAIYNGYHGTIGDITNSTFTSNSANYRGGAISNSDTIDNIIAEFVENSANSYGGAIFNSGNIESIKADFTSNSANRNGGAIYNHGTISEITGSTFTSNSTEGNGGAINNQYSGTIGDITNSTFTSNIAGDKGGAIYSSKNLNFISDNGVTLFQGNKQNAEFDEEGNYVEGTGTSNAIYMDSASGVITFDVKNGGSTYMYDAIDGTTSGYNVAITGMDKTEDKFYLFDDIKNANVSIGNVELNTINNIVKTYNFNTLNLANDFNMAVDVDLANEKMDRLTVGDGVDTSKVSGTGTINVVGMNLMSDMAENKNELDILFADNNLKGNVTTSITEHTIDHPYQTTAYSPIYKYTVQYKVQDDGGFFNFVRGGMNPTNNPSDNFNPAVLATPVIQQANVLVHQNIVNNYAFNYVDTTIPNRIGKLSSRYDNRYALVDAVSTDVNTNNPLFVKPDQESVWVKPFVTFENIPLKNGPKVNSITYGTLIGYDSNPKYYKRGFEGVWSGYIGYTGSNIHYSGVDSTSNGGLLGTTFSLYKGNFFNATTLTAGAMLDQASTMYGKDNITTLYAGVGNKVGYNLRFKEGLFTLQPSLLLSYTFGNTFDYTNSAGVRINSDPIHSIQISPGVKFYMNTKSGWQPYLGVNMMWNIMDQTHVRANGVKLPEMSIKPYVQYGIGVQKTVKDHFTAYGQAMIQNGGRNGISLTMGFKWALGKNKNKIQKVHTNENKTVLKTKSNQSPSEKKILKISQK